MPTRLLSKLRALVNWRRKETELDDEIAFHLSEETDDRTANGASLEAARTGAVRDFGNVTLVRETTRESWGWAPIERLFQDARCAFRMLRRDRAFAAVAVLTLALGIGSTTAILNVVNALVLRSLPFADADRLVVLYATTPARSILRDTTSFHDFSAWKNESHAFAAAAAYRVDDVTVTGEHPPEPLRAIRATDELLGVLDVRPVIGRMFGPEEQKANQPVVLISHDVWTRLYGRDPTVTERTVVVNEASYAILGVLPAGFQFPPFQQTDLLLPVAERTCRSCGYIRGVARLGAGASLAAAQGELDTIARRREQAFPDSNGGRGVNAVPLHEVAVGVVRTPLFVLLGAGVFVLFIGCGNVANLVLARSLSRRREFVIRVALGAGTGRLVRQLLTESMCLAVFAAFLGAVLAVLGSQILSVSLAERFPLPPVPFNWVLLAFTLSVALVSGVLSGLPPIVVLWKSRLAASIRQDRGGQEFAQRRLRSVLMASQTALTVMLLVGAGLLLKSFVVLQQVDLGLDPRHVLSADLVLSKRNIEPVRNVTFLRELLDASRALPDVRHAGLHTDSIFRGGGSTETLTIEGLPDPGPDQGHAVGASAIDGDLFPALGIPMFHGRSFDGRDSRQSTPVVIVNESMARKFWPADGPIGKRVRLFYDRDRDHWFTIVGVVGDARYRYEPSGPKMFFALAQLPYRSLPYQNTGFVSVVLRTSGEPAAVARALQDRIWAIDRNQPVLNVQPLEQILRRSVAEPRVYALLLGIFAAIALVIACTGIYALGAYLVVRRTREIGIRLAIGATPRQILSLILRGNVAMTAVGVGIGLAGSLALSRVIAGVLHGVTPTDAPTFAVVLLIFTLVAAAASYIPARRAARIDPTVAVRTD